MIVGVTGGNGFIGTWVVKELKTQGHEAVIFDRRALPYEKSFLGDVTDETAVFEFAAHVDGIIHLAAVLGTQETIQNPKPSAITNIIGSLNVFEAANRYNIPVVYAGVGNHFMRLKAAGSYTISKSCAEDYARMFNAYRSGLISVVRPVNAYGPGQSIAAPYGPSKVRKIIPSFICRALVGDPIEIYGDGTQISDCVYVKDVARVFVRALEKLSENSIPALYEVGPTISCNVKQIAAEVIRQTNSNSQLRFLPMRPGEIPNSVVIADSSTLLSLGSDCWGWGVISLEEGLKRTITYYRDNWLPNYRKPANG